MNYDLCKNVKKIHFIGIGGSGMSTLSEVLLNLGFEISGSDIMQTSTIDHLQSLGVKIFIGHRSTNIKNADIVVYSSAIRKDNPELLDACAKNTPTFSRGEMLAELMRIKYSVAISGTHGKTTTTSMLAWIMNCANLDPTIIVGGKINNIKSGARLGKGNFIVVEADESDGSFLMMNPTVAVVINIDDDHLDYYKTMNNLINSFLTFINKVPFYGLCILCNDDENIRHFKPYIKRKFSTYGVNFDSDLVAKNINFDGIYTSFDLVFHNEAIGTINLNSIGEHNVYNALAAILVALNLGVEFNVIKQAIETFKGVERRLEIKGEKNGVLVIDDYGHHPREMKVVWDAIKKKYRDKDIFVVFEPHRYTRTKILCKHFSQVLSCMDDVILLPIYAAGETQIDGVSSLSIIKYLPEEFKNRVCLAKDFEEAFKILRGKLTKNSVLLTLGAGTVVKFGEEFLRVY